MSVEAVGACTLPHTICVNSLEFLQFPKRCYSGTQCTQQSVRAAIAYDVEHLPTCVMDRARSGVPLQELELKGLIPNFGSSERGDPPLILCMYGRLRHLSSSKSISLVFASLLAPWMRECCWQCTAAQLTPLNSLALRLISSLILPARHCLLVVLSCDLSS